MGTKTDTRRTTKGRGTGARRTGATGRPAVRRSPRPAATARSTRSGGAGTAPRIPFVLLILCLLGGTLVALLVLRSVVAQEAYAITSLQSENRELSYKEQQMEDTVAHLEASERISREAEEMGMEQGEAPLFLDLDNGGITGNPGSGE
ncbi:hypothetical protein GCM10007079_33660 [Nocardiopsis terrae]|uniref:Cell division protein FtsL n=1 Tax=Nocardiopsis terrae TaxID=372655 RepID=A0ABR9HJJ2_9ACTN|nr:hypothetical protein [Nocardiopsis terrae]MBE1459179.1 hypothetical protein [Nocardiopsis terrae]GHC88590.1 hypothetical protein GCM10007079_33660 [Nocardiopsis terrae]